MTTACAAKRPVRSWVENVAPFARNVLHTFGHPVATCCKMLNDVGSSLKLVKFLY